MGANSDLVSIHNRNEQAFLTSVMAMHDSPDIVYEFWIGFHDFVHWDYDIEVGTFVWSDQSVVDYSNWAANEPNGNMQYDGICAEMWAHDDYDIGKSNFSS